MAGAIHLNILELNSTKTKTQTLLQTPDKVTNTTQATKNSMLQNTNNDTKQTTQIKHQDTNNTKQTNPNYKHIRVTM